jgi:hypothetical protein
MGSVSVLKRKGGNTYSVKSVRKSQPKQWDSHSASTEAFLAPKIRLCQQQIIIKFTIKFVEIPNNGIEMNPQDHTKENCSNKQHILLGLTKFSYSLLTSLLIKSNQI